MIKNGTQIKQIITDLSVFISQISVISVLFSTKKNEKPYKFRNFIDSNCIYSIDIQQIAYIELTLIINVLQKIDVF